MCVLRIVTNIHSHSRVHSIPDTDDTWNAIWSESTAICDYVIDDIDWVILL